jgi:hypothetical protein
MADDGRVVDTATVVERAGAQRPVVMRRVVVM